MKRYLKVFLGIILFTVMMSGMTNASEANHDHSDGIWTVWNSDNSLPGNAGNYYLANDVTLTDNWKVPAGTTNLCLNGHNIKRDGSGAGINSYIACININNSGAILNLYDCGTNPGCITVVNPSSLCTGYGVDITSGTFNMYGGSIANITGVGVVVSADATFNMYDGSIVNNINGGSYSGGVQIHGGGIFNMHGGTISNNQNMNGINNIYVYAGCFIRTGGTVNEGIVKSQYTAEIKFDGNGGSGTMYPQYILKNTSTALTANAFTHQYGSFHNWNTVQNGTGTKYNDMAEIQLSGDTTTLYAQWLLPSATITRKPTANKRIYDGTQKPLLNSDGVASGGTLQYVVGTSNQTAPTNGWEDQIPKGTNEGSYYVWVKAKGDDTHRDSGTECITSMIYFPVTFKVKNGEWNEGGFADKTVNLSRYENEDLLLTLTDSDIPSVGNKPADGYKAGDWDVTPPTDRAISEGKTYTYTYVEKSKISATVTFKVVNGSWNDGTVGEKTVTLNGYEGDALKLQSTDIPAVGRKPNDTYKAGAWDVIPSTDRTFANGSTTTCTYSYVQKGSISAVVTFNVINGSWNDGTAADKTVTLSGHEGDMLKLSADQIPAVGDKPNENYKTGSWNTVPSTETAITADTTYTYTYNEKEPEPTPKEKAEILLNAGLKLGWSGSGITLSYGAVPGATSYDIYAIYCGKKSPKKIATVTGCTTTISELNGKKLNKRESVKIYVVAKNGDTKLAKSLKVHVAGPKNQYTNAKKIKIGKKNYKLKVGNTTKLKPKLVLKSRRKKILPNFHAPKFRYASSDKSVATVNKNGKVKARGKGTCEIYIYAVNGMTQMVTVTVK